MKLGLAIFLAVFSGSADGQWPSRYIQQTCAFLVRHRLLHKDLTAREPMSYDDLTVPAERGSILVTTFRSSSLEPTKNFSDASEEMRFWFSQSGATFRIEPPGIFFNEWNGLNLEQRNKLVLKIVRQFQTGRYEDSEIPRSTILRTWNPDRGVSRAFSPRLFYQATQFAHPLGNCQHFATALYGLLVQIGVPKKHLAMISEGQHLMTAIYLGEWLPLEVTTGGEWQFEDFEHLRTNARETMLSGAQLVYPVWIRQ